MRSIFNRISLLILVILVSACSEVRIELPTKDFVDDSQPETFQVSFTKGTPSDLVLQLNTADVTSLFTTTEEGATALGADLAQHIFSGKNIFKASAGGTSTQVIFHYDTEGPVIHILNASHETGIVSGYVADVGGVQSLALDGVAVTLDENNHFSTNFSDLTSNEFLAVDGFEHQSSTAYARKDQEFVPGMSARLNHGGIVFLGEALALALGSIDYQAAIDQINPLLDFNIFGLFTASTSLKNFGFDQPTIDLAVLENERLDTDVDIPNFSIGIEVSGRALIIPFNLGGTIYIDNVAFDSQLALDIVDKDLALDMKNTDVHLDGFKIDFDHIPNILYIEDIISAIVGGVTNLLLPLFVDLIEGAILPVASEFIGEIPIELDITTAEDETLHIKALPSFLDTFDNGLTIDLGTAISAPTPSVDATPTLGSLYVAGETPTIGNTTPEGEAFDIGAAISSNVINQALFAAHEAGITTMQLRPENTPGTDPEGVSVIQSEDDDIQTADRIGMSILPASAPFIKLIDTGSAKGVLGWHDLTLEFDMKRIGWEDYQNVFHITFNLDVAFELGATDDGFLQIGVEQLPNIEVLESTNAGLVQLSPAFMNKVLDYFMPVIMPEVAAKLKAIPLPRIAGYSIHPEDFWITGSGNNNLALAGSLVKITTTEAAPAPTTILAFADASAKASKSDTTTSATTELTVNNGEVSIGISGVNPSTEALESRFRIDNGAWSIWKPRTSLNVSRLLGGTHTIQVCSRTVIMKQEQDCPSVTFETAVQ
ncbi:hypothetical protein A9Q99_20015 [Gammaproteobacteria bacterium 45_16_T64]|nr:hypothetical protein A9Q99_20015 [Gammaproteobacteria bacterium 45_16_T64]